MKLLTMEPNINKLDATQYLTRFQLKKLTTGVTPKSAAVAKVKALQSKMDLYEIVMIDQDGVDSDPDMAMPAERPKKKYKRR